jgi:Leucyl aminopeptidase
VYVAWLNGAALPSLKSKDKPKPLQTLRLFGYASPDGFVVQRALAAGNTLCRSLTVTPPNQLTPTLYRERVRGLAKDNGWKLAEYDMKKLRKLVPARCRGGAGLRARRCRDCPPASAPSGGQAGRCAGGQGDLF